jgi:hypothetical protein
MINGYHFIPYLHLPLAILAATAMSKTWDHLGSGGRAQRLALSAIVVLLFATPILVTIESLTDLPERNLIPRVFVEATNELAGLPQGRVFAPPEMGLLIGSYTPHQVWAGHWFMTPEYWPKVELYGQLISDRERASELRGILDAEQIDYVVVPEAVKDQIRLKIGDRVTATQSVGGLEIMNIHSKGTPAR